MKTALIWSASNGHVAAVKALVVNSASNGYVADPDPSHIQMKTVRLHISLLGSTVQL
jgi:hypothetical protein